MWNLRCQSCCWTQHQIFLDFINILTKDPAYWQDLLQTVEYSRKKWRMIKNVLFKNASILVLTCRKWNLSFLVIINCFGSGSLVGKLSRKCKNFERLGPGKKMYKNSQFLVFCNALYLNNGKKLYPTWFF